MVDELIGQLTPTVFEAYVQWRMQYAAAEAVAGEETEIEHEWEMLLNQREDEDGTEGETQLAGRLGQYRAGHGLNFLVEAIKDLAGKLGGGITSELQEQLCSIVELTAVGLTGPPPPTCHHCTAGHAHTHAHPLWVGLGRPAAADRRTESAARAVGQNLAPT